MLTANLRKMIAQLDDAKHRRETGLFKVEGLKMTADTIHAFRLKYLMVARHAADEVAAAFPQAAEMIVPCTGADMQRMSALQNHREVIAVYELPQEDAELPVGGLVVALDDIRDPGNLGTIIRTAAWMGVDTVICSRESADAYNPKVLQSTMGAIARVKIIYTDLPAALTKLHAAGMEIYGTFLNGDNLYDTELKRDAVIVIGNEGHGIAPATEACVSRRITIPSYSHDGGESLNAAVAAAITMAEFRRVNHNR